MPNKHFMRIREVAKDSVSVDRVACRFHPDQALVVKEQKRPKGDWPEERKIMVHCPACMQLAHTHEERERCSMTLATELHSSDGPDRAFRVAS
ncbi:MAG: hypothetical protein ABSH47_00225 [Bryobacteraceae bacterium]